MFVIEIRLVAPLGFFARLQPPPGPWQAGRMTRNDGGTETKGQAGHARDLAGRRAVATGGLPYSQAVIGLDVGRGLRTPPLFPL